MPAGQSVLQIFNDLDGKQYPSLHHLSPHNTGGTFHAAQGPRCVPFLRFARGRAQFGKAFYGFHTILHLNHCISSREGPQKARECLVFRKPSPSGGRWMAHLWARRMRAMIRIISFRSQIV